MNLQEHDNNRFTKERDNIEKYLLRIMQRYFDVENNYTQESVEAIIVESLTRFKREILKEKGYLFSLNQMTGNISLTIQDFGGEYKFDKNTAFNKDFGEDADTICEGNDPRLYDRREPNHHVHVIDDVIGLKELLNSINVTPCSHIHENKNVLDMIRYSGNLAEFDLQIIEALSQKLLKYCDNLQFKRKELSSYTKKQIEILDGYITIIRQDLDNAKQFIAESINWLDKAYKYITNSVDNFHDNQLSKLSEYVTKAQAAAILEYLKKAYSIVWEGYFPIPDGEITMTPVEEPYEDIASTDDSSSLLSIYNTGFTVGKHELEYPYGHTNVNESSNINITVPSSVISKIHNGKIKMFFRYIKDGTEYQYPLPYFFKDNNGHNVVIQGSYTEDGNIDIKMNLLSNVSLYATKDKNLYNNSIIAVSDAVPEMMLFDVKNAFEIVKVAKIEDTQKEQFIKTLLDNSHKYLFQGIAVSLDGTTVTYLDYDGNELPYTNIQNTPTTNDLDSYYGSYMSYSLSNKMEIIEQEKLTIPVIFEYKIPRITEYFENPRIYYQVLGNKEGM